LYGTPQAVTWPADGVTPSAVVTCTPFVTQNLRYSYGINGTTLKGLAGSTSPTPTQYYAAIYNENVKDNLKFTRIDDGRQAKVGDYFVMRYDNVCTSASSVGKDDGHMVAFNSTLTFVKNSDIGALYDVEIIDSTSAYHGSLDTRNVKKEANGTVDTGVGIGIMRLVLDPNNGSVLGYKWSQKATVTCFQNQSASAIGRFTKSLI